MVAGAATAGGGWVLDNMAEAAAPSPALLTLEPGRQTTIAVRLTMHEGMDGPHLFAIPVVVDDGSGTPQTVELRLSGDFR